MAKWVHRLRDINYLTKTAICASCGEVAVKWKRNKWCCLQAIRRARIAYNKRYRKRHPEKVRRHHRKYVKAECARCGFKPEHLCQLEVHHIDHNHSNNAPDNLVTWCANCHRLYHHVLSKNKKE